jgi:glycosyltransferase involved in cell wall biosynthesis
MARVCMVVFNNYVSDPRVRREAEALIERGDTVDCICLCPENITKLNGVRLFYVSGSRYKGANPFRLIAGYILFFLYAFFKVSIQHLRAPYDVVQAHTMPDFLIFTALVPKMLGAKLVLDMHDLMPEVYVAKFGPGSSKLMLRLIYWVERLSVNFADKAIAVHKPHLDILVKHGNPRAKFSIVLNVPDHRIFTRRPRTESNDGKFRLIYHGTIPKRAGLEMTLRALARARKSIPNLHFEIIGSGEGVDAMLRLAKELKLEDCVELTETVRVEKLPAMIVQADVGIVPYTADAFTQYVLPTKLLEYAALGVPAIVSRLPTVEAYFDSDMVAYFEPGNEIELAEQIVRLYRNPQLAAELAVNATRFTEENNWPQQREIYYRLVDSLLPVRPFCVNAN